MHPSYLRLSKKDLIKRIKKLFRILKNCEICPRKCQVNRLKGEKGFCKLGEAPMVSAFHPHFGEETPLVGNYKIFSLKEHNLCRGSGTIFFTSCNLSCVYCQNYEISQLRIGQEISYERLAEIMLDLQERGCCNINLVTPTPQVPQILKSLLIAIEYGLKIPLIYNTSSYDSYKVLRLLDGIIDIYMPDVKYSDNRVALRYSGIPDYFDIMKKAVKEMHRQVGDLVLNKEGVAIKGVLVRHLVLPNNLAGSRKVLGFLSKEISKNTFLNIMDQYYPCFKAFKYPELSRRITEKEYQDVIDLAKKLGLKRLYQNQ